MVIHVYRGMEFNQDISVDNYMDVFFLCHVGKDRLCEQMVTEHTLVHIVSGEMDVFTPDNRTMHYKKGDTVFLRRNHRVNKEKRPNSKGEPFVGLFLHLETDFLKRMKNEYRIAVPQTGGSRITRQNIFTLPRHPFLESLFESIIKPVGGIKKLIN